MQCDHNEYCVDTIRYMLPSMERVANQTTPAFSETMNNHTSISTTTTTAFTFSTPTLAQFGDSAIIRGYDRTTGTWVSFPRLPIIMKFRFAFAQADALDAMTASDCIAKNNPTGGPWSPSSSSHAVADPVMSLRFRDKNVYQPIVWKLTSTRHFSMIPDAIQAVDIPFEQKRDMAVFRGALTGIHRDGYKPNMKDRVDDYEKCWLIHRCRLVLQAGQSPLIDARLVPNSQKDGEEEEEIPQYIRGIPIYGGKYNYEQMLQYKAIIMLEGNDISSGLKWALYSNSVVITQRPTKTSWAMEELLEPWVHYIPINDALSDVEEKVKWIMDHPEQAQRIAYAGSLWIRDLILHPDAAADDERIYDEMLQRYQAHFLYTSQLAE